ncbi:MAG: bacteriocin [Rickettsiales bacterium]|nr:bacteriocin [Rickettsiales bacterium]
MEGEAMQGIGDLAGQQRQAKRAEEAMKQAERGQKMSAIGMGAGIGMMAGGPVGAAIGAGVGFIASEIF